MFNTNDCSDNDAVTVCLVPTQLWVLWFGQKGPPAAKSVFPFFPDPDRSLQDWCSIITEKLMSLLLHTQFRVSVF